MKENRREKMILANYVVESEAYPRQDCRKDNRKFSSAMPTGRFSNLCLSPYVS